MQNFQAPTSVHNEKSNLHEGICPKPQHKVRDMKWRSVFFPIVCRGKVVNKILQLVKPAEMVLDPNFA